MERRAGSRQERRRTLGHPTYGRRILGGPDDLIELEGRLLGSGSDIWDSLNKAAGTIDGPFGGNPRMGGILEAVAPQQGR